jgi:N-acetyl-anhydromuramyl-L-alanine amidase AmpD
MAVMTIPFVQARNYTPGRSNAIDVFVIHTMEAPEKPTTAETVANWFAGPNAPQASAHYCIDDNSVVQCVRDEDVAWHAPGANHNGLGFEHAGFAAQTPKDWQDTYSQALLGISAELVAKKAEEYHIPVVWLQVADLRVGRRGITGHAQVSDAFKKSDHRDPGPNFPVQQYLALVKKHMGDAWVPPEEHKATDQEPSQNPTLKRGASGYQVKRLQQLLEQRGFDPGAVDGVFGPATLRAVMSAQTAYGLEPDGVAGPLTWHALLASYAPLSRARRGDRRSTRRSATAGRETPPPRRAGSSR